MKVLITGSAGMLGQDLTAVLADQGHDVTPAARADLDVTSPTECDRVVEGHDAVVNAAAWTAVDAAESNEAAAFAVNAVGAANLARACRKHDARLVQISTDYVFSGDATTPYREDAALAPRSAYGRTKAAGEWAVRAECPDADIVRTSWLYGVGGQSFVTTMRRLAGERATLTVVDDQRGQPTCSRDVAEFVAALLGTPTHGGVYHASSAGETTWCGFARAIFEQLGLDPARVEPISTDAYPLPAPRPRYSVLGHDCTSGLGVPALPDWRTSLDAFLALHG